MPIKAESGTKGRIDWYFIMAGVGLLMLGTIAMLSAAWPLPYYTAILQRHFLALGFGLFLFLFSIGFNYQIFQDQARIVYGIALSLMIAVLLFGSTLRGHRAWFHIAFINFQPAELSRIAIILVLADILDKRTRRASELSTVLIVLAAAAPIMLLMLKQPDFSSALTFVPVILGMLFCAGADFGHLLAVLGFGCVTVSVPLLAIFCQARYASASNGSLPRLIMQATHFGWQSWILIAIFAVLGFLAWRLSLLLRLHSRATVFIAAPVIMSAGLLCGSFINRQMKAYQRNRFLAYVAPQTDMQGAAYNVIQSQIAIGSGGLWGKGLFSGTQAQLGFLPERHTDFIYADVGEEMGFLGTAAILALYMILISRIVAAARLARDRYGYLVCCGLASMFAFEMTLNVGMCVGLMPVAGIPLPLISYGGSSLVITLWSLGIVANIYARRYALL